MKRNFVWVHDRQIHYRSAGVGAPVVLLHPSPLSAAAVWPVAAAIAEHYQVFALDTPGYGQSEPLASPPESLADFLPVLAATLDKLGLQRVCLYGAATGAQIAIEFAKVYPERIALLVLDSAGHISAEECAAIVPRYFPDVTPQADGRHLVTLWQMVRDLFVFFPWCDTRSVSRIRRDLPPAAAMHGMLLDYLRAGRDYALAYRPAFYNERSERTVAVRVPTVLVRWEGSVALRITDALIDAGLPANFSVLRLGALPAQRSAGIAQCVRERYQAPHCADSPTEVRPVSARVHSTYIELDGLQLHLRSRPGSAGRPLLLLHSASGSARLAELHFAAQDESRPLLAMDLPGHGESDAAVPDSGIGARHDAALLARAIEHLGIDSCDLLALGSAALTARALQESAATRIHGIRQHDAPRRYPGRALRAISPDISARPDGTHLLTAWYWLRDQALWRWPGITTADAIQEGEPAASLQADLLQLQLVELMKIGPRLNTELAAVDAALAASEAI